MHFNLNNIPEIFFNSETGSPFTECKVCGETLTDGREYLIEKSFVHYNDKVNDDLVWEAAMCLNCVLELRKEYSEESYRRMNAYFESNMNFDRQRELAESQNFTVSDWLDTCVITGKKRPECGQYQIYGHFLGGSAVFDSGPFMLSGEAMDEAIQLMSNETLDNMNRFRDQHFPPPEDLRPLFEDPKFVFI
ncbi:MAG: hypothetical protein AAFW89_03625 [Bacteroidota bacterium]